MPSDGLLLPVVPKSEQHSAVFKVVVNSSLGRGASPESVAAFIDVMAAAFAFIASIAFISATLAFMAFITLMAAFTVIGKASCEPGAKMATGYRLEGHIVRTGPAFAATR